MFAARNYLGGQIMVTLTYPADQGLWELEFQQRGAPHFFRLFISESIDRNTVASAWYRIVGRFCGNRGNPPISRKVTLPLPAVKHLVHTMRKAFKKQIKNNVFRD